MLILYGSRSEWGLADLSPFVTKVVTYLKMANIPFEKRQQPAETFAIDAPFGKVPYLVTEDGEKVPDSNTIIEYLKDKYGDPFDKDLSPAEHALALAWDRLISEHLMWSGIFEPRWNRDANWEKYMPLLVGIPWTPEAKEFMLPIREHMLGQYVGQGMGRRDIGTVQRLFRKDVNALSDFLGDKSYILGDKAHAIDASMYASLIHLVDQQVEWEGAGYVQSKTNLMAYVKRMQDRFGV